MKIYKEWRIAFALVALMASQKIAGVIDWSWCIITSPIWGIIATYVLVVVLTMIWFLFKKKKA